MKKASIEDITLDFEDANLFKQKNDKILQAKAIKYSILPKLNIILEESLSRIRKIYSIEVFKENSIIHSWPNFREKRENDLQFNYESAFIGLAGSRLPIWEGLSRNDKKPVKIIPYALGFRFNEYGLTTEFLSERYDLALTKISKEKYLDFLRDNSQSIQTLSAISWMTPVISYFDDNEKIVLPFTKLVQRYKKNEYYMLDYINSIGFPLDFNRINLLIDSFVFFYPIYDSLLKIASGRKHVFKELISKITSNNYFNDKEPIDISEKQETNIKQMDIQINFDKTQYIRPGIRWQVFDRDDFRCVACGKSAKDGAILHVDHIIPRLKGGKDVLDNYQTLCHLCNIGKSNKSNRNLRN
jgi:hypothetical protein